MILQKQNNYWQKLVIPDGKGLPKIKLLTIAIYADMANFIAKQLEESGIPVQVEVVQKSLLLNDDVRFYCCIFPRQAGLPIIRMQKIICLFFILKTRHRPIIHDIKVQHLMLLFEKAITEKMIHSVINYTSRPTR